MAAEYFGDLPNVSKAAQLVAWSAQSTDNQGTGVDMSLGDGNNCVGVLNVISYDIASGNETYAITITECDTLSGSYTAVTGYDAGAFTSKTSAGSDPGTAYMQMIKFRRSKKFLRAELDVGGTSPAFTATVTVLERLKITGSGAGYQA